MRRSIRSIATGAAILAFKLVLLSGCNPPSAPQDSVMDRETAERKLAELINKIDWMQNFTTRRANVSLTRTNLLDNLPPIDQFALTVNPPASASAETVEIFASTEKSGTGTDGWLTEVARDFNQAGIRVSSGQTAQVKIREIASGTGAQFIAAGKYLPQAFTPSNLLWVKMVEAHGVPTERIRDRLIGNVAGVVMKKEVATRLRQDYPKLTVADIIDAVVRGRLVAGYTNPYASSTGLNFLISVLHTFSQSTDARMLDPGVVDAFESFQRNVPFVAMTTLQMRDAVQNSGALDAFIMEYQTFVMARPPMDQEYEFLPFGVRHDNPLYAIGKLDPAQREVLELFARHSEQQQFRQLANRYGFDQLDDYKAPLVPPEGGIVLKAQKVWKEKKDVGRPIVAVFVADVSGSMAGSRIKALRKALINGADLIATQNSIGLVTFSGEVNVALPPRPFDLIQKSAFWAAVEDLSTGGKTAMYDGIAVALQQLVEQRRANPEIKPILFVLTDGETNRGFKFDDLKHIVQGLGIPIYTIGYAEDISGLKALSSLVEAASLRADESNVGYQIGNLLNAQM